VQVYFVAFRHEPGKVRVPERGRRRPVIGAGTGGELRTALDGNLSGQDPRRGVRRLRRNLGRSDTAGFKGFQGFKGFKGFGFKGFGFKGFGSRIREPEPVETRRTT